MNSKNIFSPVVGWTLIDTIERFLKDLLSWENITSSVKLF